MPDAIDVENEHMHDNFPRGRTSFRMLCDVPGLPPNESFMPKSPLPPAWDLPQEIRIRVGEKVGRQRAMLAGGHLLLILHAPPQADQNERLGRIYWRKPDGSWQSTETSGGANTVARHLDEFARRLEQIDQAVDAAVLARDYFAVLSQLSPLVRTVRNLHKTLQEARELVPDNTELITLRDRAYELERLSELLYEDAKNGLDFAVAKRAEEQAAASRRMEFAAHRLNMLVAFFFPLATLSAILGVNVVHGLEGRHHAPLPFFLFVAAGVLLGLFLTGFIAMSMPRSETPPRDPHAKRI